MSFHHHYRCGFFGQNHNQVMLYYEGCDTEENYIKNCKLLSSSWYYYNNPIEYRYNSLGFRCDEIDFLDDDFLLFTGCSFTEGVGLHLEDTYPYIVAEKFKKTYFNLAIGGSGPDIVKDNIIMFLSYMLSKDKLPKYIIIQWPDYERLSLTGNDFYRHIFNSFSNPKDLHKEFLERNIPIFTNILNRYTTLQFIKNLGISNVIEISAFGDEHFSSDTIKVTENLYLQGLRLEKARDLAHPGRHNHKIFSEKILDHLYSM